MPDAPTISVSAQSNTTITLLIVGMDSAQTMTVECYSDSELMNLVDSATVDRNAGYGFGDGAGGEDPLDPDTQYWFRALVTEDEVPSEYSNTVDGTTSFTAITPPVASLSDKDHESITITFTAATGGVGSLSYTAAISEVAPPDSFAAAASPKVFSGLEPETTYYIIVRATDSHDNSDDSNTLEVTTDAAPSPPPESTPGRSDAFGGGFGL